MKSIERLTEIVIDALRELSAEQKSLSSTSLYEALNSRNELLQLLPSPTANMRSISSQETNHEKQLVELKAQLRSHKDREERLSRQLAIMEETSSQWRSFSKQAILTLLVMAGHAENDFLSDPLEKLRSAVLNNDDLESQQNRLRELKSGILREAPSGGSQAEGLKSKPFSQQAAFEHPSGTDSKESISPDLPGLHESLLKFLDQLESATDEFSDKTLPEIRRRLTACTAAENVAACGADILNTAKDFITRVTEERSQMTKFIQDLGKSLVNIEAQFLFSLSDTRDTYIANNEFNTTLQGQMDDLSESFGYNKTIEDTLEFISLKLETIKKALKNKKKEDELRFENADKRLKELQKNLKGMKTKISRAQKRTKVLEHEVLLDALTGIHNRRAYELRIAEELNRFKRYQQVFSLISFDVDHFKQVNDKFGHSAGDKCLKEIINRVKISIRSTDFLARYGGEEFIVLLTGTNKTNAFKAAEKIRASIEKTRFLYDKQVIPVTISLGVTEVQASDTDPQAIFVRADAAMYKAKNEGRNRVCIS